MQGLIVLKQLDLSLAAQHATPTIPHETMLSEQIILPILDSVIGNDACSLVHLQLPKEWRKMQSRMLSVFLEKYNRPLNNHAIDCSHDEGVVFWDGDQICPMVCQKGE